jgi:glutamate synthase (NADPH/NADH) large chain
MPRKHTPQTALSRAVSAKPVVSGRDPLLPQAQGLYDPAKEHDSCGVGFVANLHNAASHEIVEMGLQILLNLNHLSINAFFPLSKLVNALQ